MIYFFAGTVAEFIKLFPIMKKLEDKNIDYKVLASGQNDLEKSELRGYLQKFDPIHISRSPKNQSVSSLFIWFLRSLLTGFFRMRRIVTRHDLLIVHGDTLSSLLGAILGKVSGVMVVHLEAGLRSFNLLRPFPEEICRRLTSLLSDIALCPNDWAMGNLKNRRIVKVNTYQNTLYESHKLALSLEPDKEVMSKLPPKPYFIFITHRQENIYRRKLLVKLVEVAMDISRRMNCVCVLHSSTKKVLEKIGMLEVLEKTPRMYVFDRIPYITFNHILKDAEFIITDGGSNQEEAFYLGKPCLILRKETERIEGLGRNVVISNLDLNVVKKFVEDYKKYQYPPLDDEVSPSEIVTSFLLGIKR